MAATSVPMVSVNVSNNISEDEESFVVLCESLPPESLLPNDYEELIQPVSTAVVQESLQLTKQLVNAISDSSKNSSSLPSMPKVEGQLPSVSFLYNLN